MFGPLRSVFHSNHMLSTWTTYCEHLHDDRDQERRRIVFFQDPFLFIFKQNEPIMEKIRKIAPIVLKWVLFENSFQYEYSVFSIQYFKREESLTKS